MESYLTSCPGCAGLPTDGAAGMDVEGGGDGGCGSTAAGIILAQLHPSWPGLAWLGCDPSPLPQLGTFLEARRGEAWQPTRQRGMAWHGVAWHRVRASTCQVAPAHACQPIHRQVSTSNNVGRPSKSPTHGCSPGRPSGGRLDLMGDTRPRRGQTRGRQQVQARDGPLPRGGAQPSPALPCHRLLACSALPTAPLPCPGRAASSTRQRRARCLCCGHSAQAVLSSAWWAPY